MSHKLCYQQHPEESAGGARAELMLCCVVLCPAVFAVVKVTSQGTGCVTSLCPFGVGGSGEGCSGCPGNTPFAKCPLWVSPVLVQVIPVSLPKPFLGDSALQDLKDAACFCFL